MKNRFLALGLSIGMLAGLGLGFAGCAKTKDKEDEPPVPSVPVDPDKPDPDKPDPSKPVDPEKNKAEILAKAVAEIDAFADKFVEGKNFTYTETRNLGSRIAEVDNDKMKMTKDGVVTYYQNEGENKYEYTIGDDNVWHKGFSETDVNTIAEGFAELLDRVTWTAFDDNQNLLNGNVTLNQNVKADVVATVSNENAQIKFSTPSETISTRIDKVGITTVTLPENVKDDTIQEDVEKLFSINQDGTKTWNMPLLKQVLEEYMKGKNSENQDLYSAVTRNQQSSVEEILYINLKDKKLEIGTLINKYNTTSHIVEKGFVVFNSRTDANGKDFISKMNDGTFMTKQNLEDYCATKFFLGAEGSTNVIFEYNTKNASAEQKQQFDTMTKNIFDRIVNVGCQISSVFEEGTPLPELKGAEILFGAKTENRNTMAAMKLGNTNAWEMYFLAKIGEELEWIEFTIYSSIDGKGDAIDKVVNNDVNYTWLISRVEREEVDKDNIVLFNNNVIETA